MTVTEEAPAFQEYGDTDTRGDSAWLRTARRLSDEFEATAIEREQREEAPVAELAKLRETGLVNLLIRKDLGGGGGSLADAVRVVAEISKGDAAIGALLAFHYYVSFVPRLWDFRGDAAEIQRRSAAGNWLWANVHQPGVGKFIARPAGDGGFVINGTKRWATGGPLADVTDVIAQRTDRRELLFAVLPTDREGVSWRDDWDHLGLRLTATVTVDFTDVVIGPDEVIASTHDAPQDRFPPLYTAFVLPLYSAVFVGATRAALTRTRDYLRGRTRPRLAAAGVAPVDDPLTQRLLGHHLAELEVAQEFTYSVADRVWEAWGNRLALTDRDRGELAAYAGAARRLTADVALEATPDVYELTGTWAAINSYGLDRHWRDVRTLSLHDSLAQSLASIGDFYVNDTFRDFPRFAV
jgi:alkylation response protein AidB-like acyl-CoA dehydrogenase